MTPLLLVNADRLLRARDLADRDEARARLARLLPMVLVFGLTHGAMMGTFGLFGGTRFLQVAYSAVKVPVLLLMTFAIALPSFFVVNTLLGVRDDFRDAVRALIASQAALTVILCSLGPFAMVWYACSGNYPSAILFNAMLFAVASVGAQAILRRLYRPLIRRNPRHRLLLKAWLVVYAFVGIQMGWVLRPFIGDPLTPTRFFRDDAFSNAYLALAHIVGRLFHVW